MAERQRLTVRHRLAQATAREHESLHVHPWISFLAGPGLTEQRYRLVLASYLQFYTSVEMARSRAQAFPDLSLRGPIDALAFDVAGNVPVEAAMPGHYQSEPAFLGALYVLHGAGFGARTLCSNVRGILPYARCSYLTMGTAPKLWRALVAELETHGEDETQLHQLIESAASTFRRFGHFVTQYCETMSTGNHDQDRPAGAIVPRPVAPLQGLSG